MAIRLSALDIEEVSGVENPANELPGFLVQKAKEAGVTSEELLKEVDRMESDLAILYSALQSADSQGYLADAPQEVQDAKTALLQYIEGLFGEGTDPAADEGAGDNTAEPVGLSADKPLEGEKRVGLLERLGIKKGDTPVSPIDRARERSGEVENDGADPEAGSSTSEQAATPQAEPEKPDPPEVADVEKALTAALVPVLEKLAVLDEVVESVDVVKTVTDTLIDRVSAVEAGRQGLDPEDVKTLTTKSTDSGEAQLRAGFRDLARGGRIQLG